MKKPSKLTSRKIFSIIEQHTNEIRKFKVKRIGLFGSFLKGKATKKSDIDFLVEFEEPTFDNYMELKFLLEGIFHKKVDLVTADVIKPALKHITKEALYAS